MKVRHLVAAVVAATLPLALTAPGYAAVAGTTGAVQLVASPPSLAAGAFTSDTSIRAINEKSLTLVASLNVIGVGSNGWTSVTTLAAGTCIQSHMVHMNRTSATAGTLAGTVSFNSNVVGVATDVTGILTGVLSLTDPLFGNPGTTYPTGVSGRGLELSPLDSVRLTAPKTITLSLTAGPDMDELRIITLCDQAPVVPETRWSVLLPVSALLVGSAVVIVRRRRTMVDA
jgi:hypothetical protein